MKQSQNEQPVAVSVCSHLVCVFLEEEATGTFRAAMAAVPEVSSTSPVVTGSPRSAEYKLVCCKAT